MERRLFKITAGVEEFYVLETGYDNAISLLQERFLAQRKYSLGKIDTIQEIAREGSTYNKASLIIGDKK
jgi:hypothetical protein